MSKVPCQPFSQPLSLAAPSLSRRPSLFSPVHAPHPAPSLLVDMVLLTEAIEELGETEIREAHLFKAEYLCRIGDKEAAETAFRVTTEKTVLQLRHHYDSSFLYHLPHFSALHHPTRTVGYTLVGARASRMLIDTCYPMLCPIHFSGVAGAAPRYRA